MHRAFRNDHTTDTFDRLTRAAQIESATNQAKFILAVVILTGSIIFLGLAAISANLMAAGLI